MRLAGVAKRQSGPPYGARFRHRAQKIAQHRRAVRPSKKSHVPDNLVSVPSTAFILPMAYMGKGRGDKTMAPIWRSKPSTRGCRMKLHLQGLLPAGRVVRPHRSFHQDICYSTTIRNYCQCYCRNRLIPHFFVGPLGANKHRGQSALRSGWLRRQGPIVPVSWLRRVMAPEAAL